MAQSRALQNPQNLHRASRLAANLLAVFAIVAATLFSFLFFSNVAAAWTQVHDDSSLPAFAKTLIRQAGKLSLHLPVITNSLRNLSHEPQPESAGAANPAASSGPSATPIPWDGTSRVTVLLMGLDYRDWQEGDVPRSDSMWIVTVDPVTKTAGMMSIPRDTWVAIPGFDAAKINMAYFYGEAYHTPGGGPQLAMQTVSQFLGVPIQFYAVVDFNSFVKFIDKLDGIYVDVPEEIRVDPLGPGNTVTLEAGRQRLFGDVALAYARNRYTANGDFDRAKRQLQIILGVRDRVLDAKYLPILITHAPEVYDIVSSGVRTNLKLDQAIRLAWLAQEVKPENIRRGTLGRDQMIDSYSVQGWSIEIPIMEQVLAMRDQVFSTEQTSAPGEPAVQAETPAPADGAVQPGAPQPTLPPSAESLPEAVAAESARIILLNGTATSGLAMRTSEYLRSLGLTVLEPADAQGAYITTTLVEYTGKSATAEYLAELMHIDPGKRLGAPDPGLGADLAIVLGDDWANNNPMP